MPVKVAWQPSPCNGSQIEADVKTLCLHRAFDRLTPPTEALLQIEQGGIRKRCQGGTVIQRSHKQVAVGIGKAIDHNHAVRCAFKHADRPVFGWLGGHGPADKAFGVGAVPPASSVDCWRDRAGVTALHIAQSPRCPESFDVHAVHPENGTRKPAGVVEARNVLENGFPLMWPMNRTKRARLKPALTSHGRPRQMTIWLGLVPKGMRITRGI